MIKQISIERTMCYGECPVYKATLYASGRVVYDGKYFVAKEGRNEWKITNEKVEELFKYLIKRGIFKLNDNYTSHELTCQASCITKIKLKDGTKKTIEHYFGDSSAPKLLTTIENKIDHLLGTPEYTVFIIFSR